MSTATDTTTPSTPPPSNTAAEQFAKRRQSPIQRVQHTLHAHPAISPFLVLVVSWLVFTYLNPNFGTLRTTSLILQQVAVVGALAIGQTLIILTAGIDLSVGAIAILAMLFSAKLSAEQGVPGIVAIVLGILAGTAAGAINGLLVTRLKLPPFIVTLGTLSVFTAMALLYSGGQSISGSSMPDLMSWTGTVIPIGDFRLTTGVLMVLAMYAVVAFALKQTTWGRHVYAVGNDPEAARLVGISTNRVLLSVYTVAGLIYGITAWVLIGRAGAAGPNAAADANLESITAVVIGGTSLFGGRGAVFGTLLGALIVGFFRTGLSLAGVDDQWRVLTIGLLVIIAVSIDQWIRKVRA
ncbi:fructose transport system permease protein [Nocardioides scoriae]|uniref:Fructose transport system permease protein n=1 Tax=Nocardioides scoriae TaxID=642780 RepID=A0A1H1PZR5_9ACTN|nr:ABC transporter permease [Nocardioides scoriae]SDS16698.1 fructose transport system permease protein [Nocardioides scoriae]